MFRICRVVLGTLCLCWAFSGPVLAAKPASKVLPPGGNTIAGPGSFNLDPGTGELVYRSAFAQPTNARICVTVVVTSLDAMAKLNVVGYPSMFVSAAASQSFCNDTDAVIELRCNPENVSSCTGFWRVDILP